MIEGIIENYIGQLQNQLEDKLKEACELWGVNINDHEEVKRRCEIRHIENINGLLDDKKEVYIDGHLVMIFTDWKMEAFDSRKPFKMSASFKCSEIIKP